MHYEIPQIFYDIIARVIPGTIIIICVFLTWQTDNATVFRLEYLMNYSFNFYQIIFLLVISYMISSVFSHIYDLVSRLFANNLALFEKIFYKVNTRTICQNSYDDCCRLFEIIETGKQKPLVLSFRIPNNYYVIHDLLRIQFPMEAKRLMKINAESRASKTLTIGFLVVLLLRIVFHYHNNDSSFNVLCDSWVWISIILSYIFYTRANKLEYYFRNGIHNILWYQVLGLVRANSRC